jgi:hypothetical protein
MLFSSRVSSYNHVLSVFVVVRRLGPSSFSRARFVTAGSIELKRCIYIPLGEMSLQTKFRSDLILGLSLQTKFRSDLILGLATRGPKPKTQKVLRLLN